jgi:hypothetical protein
MTRTKAVLIVVCSFIGVGGLIVNRVGLSPARASSCDPCTEIRAQTQLLREIRDQLRRK